MLRRYRMLISAGINLALIAALVTLARLVPQIFPLFFTQYSRGLMRFLGSVTSILPIPLWQLLLVGLVLWQLISLVRSFVVKRFLDWLFRFLLIVTALVLVFVATWGLNFFGPPIGSWVGLSTDGGYTQSQLEEALYYYAQEASSRSTQVTRDENGDLVLPAWEQLSNAAVSSYGRLGERWDRFRDPAPRVKRLLLSEGFGYLGVTGIFVCFTGEASVSSAAYSTSIPYTMCHELGHSLAFCGEDEANFAAFLACVSSDDPLFRYSGSLAAFRECYHALYQRDPDAARKVWDVCSDELIHDCSDAYEHYQKYEGVVQDAAQSVNDAYLRSFDQEGTESYDLVTDHLIAYYLTYLKPAAEPDAG